MSLSVVLLVGAGLFVHSLRNVTTVQSGVDIDRTLIARVDLRRAGYTREAREAFYEDALTRLSTLPGVERAAVDAVVRGGGHAHDPPCWAGPPHGDPACVATPRAAR